MAGPLSDLGLEWALNDALLKLSATLPASQREDVQHLRERIHMDTTWWYYSRESLPHLSLLQDAIYRDRAILLSYPDERTNVCQRLLHPYGLVSKAGTWFLVALHAQSGEQQVLRVSRIQFVEISEASFVRPLTSILPPPGATIAARWKRNTHNWPARPAPSPAKRPCGQYREPAGKRNKKNTFHANHNKKTRLLDRHNKKRNFVIRGATASCRSTKKSKNGSLPSKKANISLKSFMQCSPPGIYWPGFFYGKRAAKFVPQTISLFATSF